MKTYKLLKYIEPAEQSIKLGTTFTLNSEYLLSDNEEQIPVSRLIRQGYIEEVKDTKHPGRYWKPKNDNTKYYYISSFGDVDEGLYDAVESFNHGNAYPIKELAQKELDKRKAIVKIKEYISDTYGIFEPDWDNEEQDKYSLYYNHINKSFDIEGWAELETYSPIGYFSCEEHALDISEKFDKELRLIYNKI